jgi:hypothetical protein
VRCRSKLRSARDAGGVPEAMAPRGKTKRRGARTPPRRSAGSNTSFCDASKMNPKKGAPPRPVKFARYEGLRRPLMNGRAASHTHTRVASTPGTILTRPLEPRRHRGGPP